MNSKVASPEIAPKSKASIFDPSKVAAVVLRAVKPEPAIAES
jgi:hypothetical protein